MPSYKTKQTYDVRVKNGDVMGRFMSLTEARKKACTLVSAYMGKYTDIEIVKNPKITANGIRPAFVLVTVTTEMFIRPKYEFKHFGKEAILKDDAPTGRYKYYLIGSQGNILDTDSHYAQYFDHSMIKAGIWSRPRKY